MCLLFFCPLFVLAEDNKTTTYSVSPRVSANINGTVEIPDQTALVNATVRVTCKPQDNYGVKAVYYAVKNADGTFSPSMPATPDNTWPDDRAAEEQVFKFTMPAGNVEVWADFAPLRTLFIHAAPHGSLKALYGVKKNSKADTVVRNLPAMPVRLTVLPDSDITAKSRYRLLDVELVNLDLSYCVKTATEITVYLPTEDDTVHVTPVFGKSHYDVKVKVDNPNITTVAVDNAAPKRREEVTLTIQTRQGYIPDNVSFSGCKSSWQVGNPKPLADGGWEVVWRFKVDLEDVTVHVGHQQVFTVTVNDTQKSGRVKTYVPEMIPGFSGVARSGQQVPVVFQMPGNYSAKFKLGGEATNSLVYHNALQNSFADEGMEGWEESNDYVSYGLPTKVFTDSLGNRYWHTSVKNTMWQTVSLSGRYFPNHAVSSGDKLSVAAIASINPCSAHAAKASIVASGSFGTDDEQVVADMQEKNTGWTTVLWSGQINRKASQVKFKVDAEGSNKNKNRAYEGPMFDDLCLLLPASADTIRNEDVLIFTVGSQNVTVDYTPSGQQNQVSSAKAANASVTLINTVTGEQGETVKAIKNDLIVVKARAAEDYSISRVDLSADANDTDNSLRLRLDSINADTRDYFYHFIMEADKNPVVKPVAVKSKIVLKSNYYGGLVRVDKPSPNKGDKVTVTVTANPGCRLKQIRIVPEGIVTFKEEHVDSTTGAGTYSFEMPGARLSLYPEFFVPIKTAVQLDSLSKRYGEFYLVDDLDLGDSWGKAIQIYGDFDGRGHRITYSGTTSLFANVMKDASVRHLYVKANVKGSGDYIGGIASSNNGTIEDCVVSGLLENGKASGVLGGVAGQNGPLSGTISRCHVLCDTINGSNVYGIACQEAGATVSGNVFSGQFVYRAGRAYMISNDLKDATIQGNYYLRNDANLRAEVCDGAEEKTPASLAQLADNVAEAYPVFAASIKNQYSGGFAVKLSCPEGVELVNLSSKTATAGNPVSISVRVFGNSHLQSISVAAPDGSNAQNCPFTDHHNNICSFSFVMPPHDVLVTFKTQAGQIIYTPQQLMAIDEVEGIFYLGRDMELNNWEKELTLNGTLYGGGHTIRYSASNECYGLFKKIRPGALLQDLRVVGTVETTTDCGGIVYENQGTIRDCHFSGRIQKLSNKMTAVVRDAVSAIACITDKDNGLIDHCSATAQLVSPNSQAAVDRNPLCFQGVSDAGKNLWVSPTQTNQYQQLLTAAEAAMEAYPVYAQGVIDKINPCIIVGSDTIRVRNGQRLSELTITDGQPLVCTSDIQVDRVVYRRRPTTNVEQWVLPFGFNRMAGDGTFEYHQMIEENGVPDFDKSGTTLTLTASAASVNYQAHDPWMVKSDGSEYVLTNADGPITIKATTNSPIRLYGSLTERGLFYAAYDSIPAMVASEGLMYTWDTAIQEFACSDTAGIAPQRFYVQFYSNRNQGFVKFPNTKWGRKYAASLGKSAKTAPRRLASALADGWQAVFLDPRQPQSVTAEMLEAYEVAYLDDVKTQTVGQDAEAPLSVVSLVYQMVESEEELPEAMPLLVRAKRSDAKPLADEQTGAEIEALLLMSMLSDDTELSGTELDDFHMPHYWCASFGKRLDIWPLPSPERYADMAEEACLLFDDNYFEQSFHYPELTDGRMTAPMSYGISVLNTNTYEPLPLLGNRVYVEFLQPETDTTGVDLTTGPAAKGEGSGDAYNLSGQRVNGAYKGIILQNGRKIYRK